MRSRRTASFGKTLLHAITSPHQSSARCASLQSTPLNVPVHEQKSDGSGRREGRWTADLWARGFSAAPPLHRKFLIALAPS
jgi:hypothetical protein